MFRKKYPEKNLDIRLNNNPVKYTLKTSSKAKRMRLAIYCDGSLVVTRPFWLSDRKVERFILEKSSWVIKKLEHFKNFTTSLPVSGKSHYLKYKSETYKFIEERIKYYNEFYNFKFNRINIKNQKTRWGSCSKKGNLNFNYRILFLPKRVADYIIVHELCHIKEFNHSKNFWNLVAERLPDHKNLRKELKLKI